MYSKQNEKHIPKMYEKPFYVFSFLLYKYVIEIII